MASITLNPGAGNGLVFGTHSNGAATFSSGDASAWNALRAGTSTTLSVSGDTSAIRRIVYADGGTSADPTYYLGRAFYPFDATAIPGIATAATLRIYIEASGFTATSPGGTTLYLVQSTQASLTSLATSDWTLIGTTSFCDTHPTISTLTTNAYLEMTLNAAGISALASNARLALLHSRDALNVAPFTPFVTATYDDISSRMVGATSNKPELVVTYTPASGSTFRRRRPSGLYTR